MNRFAFLVLFSFVGLIHGYDRAADTVAAGTRSTDLFNAMNTYRTNNAKSVIPFSRSLQLVAQLKCDDAEMIDSNYNAYYSTSGCCPFYSWTSDGPYDGHCHTGTSTNIRKKGQEVSTYSGNVYTSNAIGTFANADACITYWQGSSYKDKILNLSPWNSLTWQAAGCAYSARRCSCVFGTVVDTGQRNYQCDGKMSNDTSVCSGGIGTGVCSGTNECKCWPNKNCDGSMIQNSSSIIAIGFFVYTITLFLLFLK